MPSVVGRRALVTQVYDLLCGGDSVALYGPAGVGKSALLGLVERVAAGDGARVLRCTGAVEEVALPYAALRDLLAQCPPELVAGLPGLPAPANGAAGATDLAIAVHDLLGTVAARTRLVLLLDDVQWLDPESSVVLGYVRRRLRGALGIVASVGGAETALVDTDVDVSELYPVEVPPLSADDMVELLCEVGLSPDVARRVHLEAGGIPSHALALAGLVGERPVVMGGPAPLPSSVERVLRERVRAQPEAVRTTLVHAALLHRPRVRDLERAGRVDAEAELRAAEAAGLVVRGDGALRFTPSALRAVVVSVVPAAERAALHRALAAVVPTVAQRLRHLALADPRPDADLALELGQVARESAGTGARELAAELYLLAADRSPLELAGEQVEWRVNAAETAAPGNHVDLVRRALADVLDVGLSPSQAVRMRLAIPELAGHGVGLLDEVLAAALTDAGDDDLLVARVLLQRARIALMEARPQLAHTLCERAVEVLERHGDTHQLSLGLTTLAVARRWVGADHAAAIGRAVALSEPAAGTVTGFVHISPEYMAARFAFYDDRLEEAWAANLAMLARVERGAGADHVHVLRCLVEVAVRTGRSREAVEYAARAARIGEEFDLEAHTSWFITALTETVDGDLARAITLARRGAEAAEERGDVRYRLRHLIVLGHALLRSGDASGAHAALAEVAAVEREGGYADPTVHRWHADLVAALTALGRLPEAADVLAGARAELERRAPLGGTEGASAQLDRAEAELLLARGEPEAAELVLDRAAKVLADLGLRVEQGRALVTRGHLERRRRRVAASRGALREALELFTGLHAGAWVAQVAGELSPEPVRISTGGSEDPLLDRLTETEARMAREVAAGASNREISERTYVSVKTVEATLTRIYRKLDVRSRTQLAALLVPPPFE